VPSARGYQEVSVRKSIRGYNLVNWSEDGVDYWAAGRRSVRLVSDAIGTQ
jgi:anti-sigma factor RsiW